MSEPGLERVAVSRRQDVTWPEKGAKKKSPGFCRKLLNWFSEISVAQLLSIICLVLAAVVIGLGLVLGASVGATTNQKGRLDNIGTRVNEQQVRIDQLQNQVNDLQQNMNTRSAPR